MEKLRPWPSSSKTRSQLFSFVKIGKNAGDHPRSLLRHFRRKIINRLFASFTCFGDSSQSEERKLKTRMQMATEQWMEIIGRKWTTYNLCITRGNNATRRKKGNACQAKDCWLFFARSSSTREKFLPFSQVFEGKEGGEVSPFETFDMMRVLEGPWHFPKNGARTLQLSSEKVPSRENNQAYEWKRLMPSLLQFTWKNVNAILHHYSLHTEQFSSPLPPSFPMIEISHRETYSI